MNGIDISHWQGGMKLENISGDFAIIKATEGTYYVDDRMEEFYAAAKRSGKLRGLYHFASGTNGARAEADYFIDHIRDKIGDAILVLDWEGNAKNKGVSYAKEFLDRVYERTGVRAFIYMSKSLTYSYDWSSVAASYPLWVAQYPGYDPIYGYQDNPWTDNKGYGAWKAPIIFQYTSSGYLPGWGKRLDLNKAYITREEWLACQGRKEQENDPEPEAVNAIDVIANEVIQGKWGNEPDRTRRIMGAIQGRVNELVRERK